MTMFSAEDSALMNCASDDATRINLRGVNFTEKHAVSTNGHMLAVKRLDDEPARPVGTFILPKKPKYKSRAEFVETTRDRLISPEGDIAERIVGCEYPNWSVVLPDWDDKQTVRITLDPGYLVAIAKALSGVKPEKHIGITIQFNPDEPTKPILCTVGYGVTNRFGVLMPMTPVKDAPSPYEVAKKVMA